MSVDTAHSGCQSSSTLDIMSDNNSKAIRDGEAVIWWRVRLNQQRACLFTAVCTQH